MELHSASYNLLMSHISDDKVKPMRTAGKFYAAIERNPQKFIEPQPEMCKML
jgi:hypothetical protein